MNFYYLERSGISVALSSEVWYLGIGLMGLITITAGFAVGIYTLRKWRERSWGWCDCRDDMIGKVVVITGGNSGIGLETAHGLAERGALVVLACRNPDKAHAAIAALKKNTAIKGELMFMEVDLSSPASVRVFTSRLLTKFQTIDVLINNAGVYHPPQEPPLVNAEGVELHFAVNHLGHFLLTHLLTDTIAATPNSRIVIVSSELYKGGKLQLDDMFCRGRDSKAGRNPLYINSKLANLLHARELHKRLKSRGVTVCALSPGFVYTGLFRHSLHTFTLLKKFAFLPIAFLFMRSAGQGAQTSIHCAVSSKVGLQRSSSDAAYYQNCGEARLAAVAQDDTTARTLWDHSMDLLCLT